MEQQHPELTAEPVPMWARPVVMLSVFVPLSLLGGLLPSFSVAANLYVLTLGSAMLAAGMSSRLPRREPPARLAPGVCWWLLPIGVLVVVETITFVLGSTHDYPTLSVLADPVLDGYPMRSLSYFGWFVGFWGLARR